MKKMVDFTYSSSLSSAIKGLISEKRALGFEYNANSYVLKELDSFCIENGFEDKTVTKELSDAWSVQRNSEGLNARNIRVRDLRQLSRYILSTGQEAYIPLSYQSSEYAITHVFTRNELTEFFSVLDSLIPVRGRFGTIVLRECQTLFRLYYCLGLRLSEPLELTWDAINLHEGWIKIIESKGHKDRILWLNDDIVNLLREFTSYIQKEIPGSSYVFPGTKPEKNLSGYTVNRYFNKVLNLTSYSCISNPPTVKSFRHTFVVDRLNSWMEAGEDVNAKLPYLCKFLGHKTIHESVYYYHQVDEAFRIIRQKDKTSEFVIPEVTYEI